MVYFEDLPFELHRAIDGYLGRQDHLQCKKVCLLWYGIFDGLGRSNDVAKVDTPAQYWSLVKKYSCKYIRRATSLTIDNVPIDLGMDLIARSSISLTSLSLTMLDQHATRLAFSGKYPTSSAYTSDGIRWKLHITRMLRVYAPSLSSLVLSYPTSDMNVDLDALITALPLCLNSLNLHQIDLPVSVLHLEHLYSTCGRLSKISLQGYMFQKLDRPDVQHPVTASSSNNNNNTGITSLELDFVRVDSVRQIMEFITVVQPGRHLKLQHVNLNFGHLSSSPKRTQILGRVNDCPQQLYDTFARNCQQLTTLSFSRVLLINLLDAFYYRTDDGGGYHGPVRLAINKSILKDKGFTDKLKNVVGQVIESVSVMGEISYRDMMTLRELFAHSRRLQQLEVYGNQQQSRVMVLVNNLQVWDPFNFRRVEPGAFSDMKSQRLNTFLPLDWGHMIARAQVIPRHRFRWLLDSLSNTFTSLTLRQVPVFIHDNQLYLSTRLRQLTLEKTLISEPYLKILFYLDALEDLHLDHCLTTQAVLHLNLMASKKLDRLTISQLAMQWREKGSYVPTYLSTLHLLQVRQGDAEHVEQKFQRSNGYAMAVMFVTCWSLQVLVIDGKSLLE